MAAELTMNSEGKAQVITVGETAWHNDGYNFDAAITFDEAMGNPKYGLAYGMKKVPFFMHLADGTQVESHDTFYVLREDNQKVLGTVGGSYEIVDNAQAFRVLKPLMDDGFLTLETAGVLREGADAWVMGKWDLTRFGSVAREVFKDEILPYSTVMANHNGRRNILIGDTPVRIVCANTLAQAETNGQSRWVGVDHRAGAGGRLVEAARTLWGDVIERYEVLARQYQLLMDTVLTEEMFKAMILDLVVPHPKDDPKFNPDAKLAESVVDRADRKRAELSRLWFAGKGHDGRPTAWFAYNAVAEALDHNKDLWPTKGGSWRSASMLTGQIAEKKNRVLDTLVNFALSV
jgi:phage/plasmid-like protein (TIGR03299 family)